LTATVTATATATWTWTSSDYATRHSATMPAKGSLMASLEPFAAYLSDGRSGVEMLCDNLATLQRPYHDRR
jgi:hypothetical protein